MWCPRLAEQLLHMSLGQRFGLGILKFLKEYILPIGLKCPCFSLIRDFGGDGLVKCI